jgi:hypothetical protein
MLLGIGGRSRVHIPSNRSTTRRACIWLRLLRLVVVY